MSDDLDEIERLARSCLRSVAASERRKLFRQMARDIRQQQVSRISDQRDPDGHAFAPRRERKPDEQGGYTIKFLYPKGDADPRLVLMKSWVRQGPLITGYDIEAGGIRSFFWDKIAKWLRPAADERLKGSKTATGRLRRKGMVKQKAMFRKLGSRQLLDFDVDRDGFSVGWEKDGANRVAAIHQGGERDRPSKKGKPVRYARRVLLGLTNAERGMLVDRLLEHLAGA